MGRQNYRSYLAFAVICSSIGVLLAWHANDLSNRARLGEMLYLATCKYDYPRMEFLLKEGVDPDARGPKVQIGLPWYRRLLALFKFQQSPNMHCTALMRAAECDDLEAIRILVNYRANVNLQSDEPMPPVGEHFPAPNELKVGGYTALAIACRYGYKDAVQCLVQHGANPNIARNDGRTPVYLAWTRSPPLVRPRNVTYTFEADHTETENAEIVAILKRAGGR